MRKNLTHITIVLDRSGSMASILDDTQKGFDYFIKEQKKVIGDCSFTLVQFDTVYEFVYNAVNLQSVGRLTLKPRGGTALLDAVGRAINETGDYLKELPEFNRPEKVIFVIITDGEENSSKEYTKQKVRGMIEHQSTKYSWQFVYLGANQDAFQEAGAIGIPFYSTINYATSPIGIRNVYTSTTESISSYRVGTTSNVSYLESDRKKAEYK